MLKGVTISLVPLSGLGSDQKEKCDATSGAVESYHLDKFCGSHANLLMSHLRKYTHDEKSTIILFVSPQQIEKNSMWYAVLHDLASRGGLSAFCIDEVHSTVQNDESFRPEFRRAIDAVHAIVSVARNSLSATRCFVPILAMLATFTMSDQNSFNNLIRRQPTIVFGGEMDRRNIAFTFYVAGNPMHSLIGDWT